MSTNDELYVVRVEDAISAALAGHEGRAYLSPPQSREQALALVALLAGDSAGQPPAGERWTLAVAGGRRRIALVSADAARPAAPRS
jgi:hypothetical protein